MQRLISNLALLLGLALAGCGGNNSGGLPNGGDGGTTPQPDFAPSPDMTVLPTTSFNYVVDKLIAPMTRTDFAIDLNGDGHLDNQFGNIVGALTAQNFDVQTGIDTQIMMGTTIELVTVTTTDATEMNDPAATTSVLAGMPMAMPVFDGTGMFTVDTSQAAAAFHGPLTNGSFSSENPVTTRDPVSLTLSLELFPGNVIALPIHGAHVSYDATPMGLMNGELQGSVKEQDVQTIVVPAIAKLLTETVMQNPGTPTSMQILQLFDVGDGNGGTCTNPDGTMGKPGDGIISPCEVAMNNIIQNVLAPDVQIYDANGNYAPNPANTNRDSLSLAVGFKAVAAKF